MSSEEQILHAVELAKAGQRYEARQIVTRILVAEKDNASAWLVMAQLVADREQAIDCLRQVMRLQPDNERVRARLAYLEEMAARPQAAKPSSTVSPIRVADHQPPPAVKPISTVLPEPVATFPATPTGVVETEGRLLERRSNRMVVIGGLLLIVALVVIVVPLMVIGKQQADPAPGGSTIGPADAPVVIVEYSDFY